MKLLNKILTLALCCFCLVSCQTYNQHDRSTVSTELEGQSLNSKFSKAPELSDNISFYQYGTSEFKLWDGDLSVDNLVSVSVKDDFILLDLWSNRNDIWSMETILYPNSKTISDYISLKIDGFYQIAKVDIELSNNGKVQLAELKTLTKGSQHHTYPQFVESKNCIIYSVLSSSYSICKYDLNTAEESCLLENGQSPQWLPELNGFIYLKESQNGRLFQFSDLNGEIRDVVASDLRLAIRSSNDLPSRSYYGLTLADLLKQESKIFENTEEFLVSVYNNSPRIKAAKYKLMASLEEYMMNRVNKRFNLALGAAYSIDNYIFTDEGEFNAGDVTTLTDFIRLTGAISYPVIATMLTVRLFVIIIIGYIRRKFIISELS